MKLFFDRYHRFSTRLVLSLLILGRGVSCNQQPVTYKRGEVTAVETEGIEQILRIAVIPAVSVEQQEKQLQPLSNYLEHNLNKSVQIHVVQDYDAAVDLLITGKVQMAYLGPFSYIKARDRDPDLEPIVAAINKTTGRPWYKSLIVTQGGSGIKSLEALRGRRFAFVSEFSTSGFLMPRVQFQSIGLNPESDFTKLAYSGSHDTSLELLQIGKVDAIAIDSKAFQAAQNRQQIQRDNYTVIWESDPIPTEPIVVSSDMPDALVAELKEALVNAPTGLVGVSGSESLGYTLVEDADYEPIRKIYRAFAN